MLNAALCLLPVLLFLAALVLMDSFKLVAWRAVLAALAAGVVAALFAAALNGALADAFHLVPTTLSRYVAPVGEETLKALYVLYLVRQGRVGFVVDAAVLGFAVGAGFAVVENVDYLRAFGERQALLWIVRGFGTALLHGGSTAIVATVTKALHDREARPRVLGYGLPGLLAAILLHSFFNHFVLPPVVATLSLVVALPLLMIAVFERSERATRAWLGVGLDTEVELLESILTGSVLRTRVGAYLESLKAHLPGPVVADMLCLLRVNLELALCAKGLLVARGAGLHLPVGEDVRANLQELRYLEGAVGRTGLLAMKPILRQSSRDLWQVYLLEMA